MIINIEKRHVFLIVGVLVFFGGLFFVNAFGTSVPATLGHSSAEIIVDDAFCNRITGHGCGVDIDTDTNTNAVTECLDDEFLDGDGSCLTAEEIVGVVGGGEMVCEEFVPTVTLSFSGFTNMAVPIGVGSINELTWCREKGYMIAFPLDTIRVNGYYASYDETWQRWNPGQCVVDWGCLAYKVTRIECCK